MFCSRLALLHLLIRHIVIGYDGPMPVRIKRRHKTSDVRRIEIGKSVEREIRGAESHTYEITLNAGQYLKATIDQRGIDLKVIAIAADGKLLFEFNSESRKQGRETVAIVAEATGTHRLHVEPAGEKITAGRYEIRVTERRTATEQDRQSQAARKLLDESVRLWRKGQRDAALPLAQQALEIRQKALGPDRPKI